MQYFKCKDGVLKVSDSEYENHGYVVMVDSYVYDRRPDLVFKGNKYFKLIWSNGECSEQITEQEFNDFVNNKTIELWRDYHIQDISAKRSSGSKPSHLASSAADAFCKLNDITLAEFMQRVYVNHIVNKQPLVIKEEKEQVPKPWFKKVLELIGVSHG